MKRKNPFVGGLLNLLIPGLRYAYLGRWGRAVVDFIAAVVGLGALLFFAGLLEATDPPWPQGLCGGLVVLLYACALFVGGVVAVRQHNQQLSAGARTSQAGGQRTVIILLSVAVVVLLVALAVMLVLNGPFKTDQWTVTLNKAVPTVVNTRSSIAFSTTPRVLSTRAARPTAARVATSTPEATPEPRTVVTHETLNVRSGPGTQYDKIGMLRRGDEVTMQGRNQAGTWLSITLADGTKGWIYADYTKPNGPVQALPIAKAPAVPTPSAAKPAAAAPAAPTPTLSIDEQIARIAKGQHGTLPQPGEVGGVDAGGEAEVTVLNDTPYVLTLLIGSPNSVSVSIEACPGCKVYSMVGPAFCQEEGRPRKTLRLKPGTSSVVAKVGDPSVIPFYGTWELKGNTSYFNCFFIVTTLR